MNDHSRSCNKERGKTDAESERGNPGRGSHRGGGDRSREAELQRVSERILETAKSLSVPIILGARVDGDPRHKEKIGLEDLKEAGDIGQDAHLVLGLYTDAVEKAIEDGTNLAESALDIKVKVLKNRNGPINQEAILRFNRPLMKISE